MQTNESLVRKIAVAGVVVMTMCAACSSVPPAKTIPHEEIVKQDNALGLELAHQFEDQVKVRQERDVQVYLAKLADALASSNAELKATRNGVLMVRDHENKWKDYSLPGNRIYLSLGFVKSVEFENELAAAVAMELGHIVKRHAMERLQKIQGISGVEYANLEGLLLPQPGDRKKIDFTGPAGVFEYSDEALAQAAEVAVDLLYKAGYDPRGVVNFWNHFAEDSAHSPYDSGTVDKVVERARRAIALYVPLRNPIVRSQDFLGILRRIRRL